MRSSLDSAVFDQHIIVRHKEFVGQAGLIKDIVEDPDFVMQDKDFSDTRIYCRYKAMNETKQLYTNVCVEFQANQGSVKTAFRSLKISDGKVVIVRKIPT